MSETIEREKLYTIMMEESAEVAEQARAARHKLLTHSDCVYWLERSGEHFRRYAEWTRTPPPHTAAMLAWAKRRIADIKALQAAEMAGWNEREERERLEAFVGEWES